VLAKLYNIPVDGVLEVRWRIVGDSHVVSHAHRKNFLAAELVLFVVYFKGKHSDSPRCKNFPCVHVKQIRGHY